MVAGYPHHFRRLLPMPAIIFMVIVTQIPLLFTLSYSLERWNLLRPERRAFIGIANYPDVLTDPTFWTMISINSGERLTTCVG